MSHTPFRSGSPSKAYIFPNLPPHSSHLPNTITVCCKTIPSSSFFSCRFHCFGHLQPHPYYPCYACFNFSGITQFFLCPPIPYSFKHLWGLKTIIKSLLDNGFLKPTHSPYNIPIFLIRRPSVSYRLVQDFRVINDTVSQFTSVTHFTVINLKNAFHVLNRNAVTGW